MSLMWQLGDGDHCDGDAFLNLFFPNIFPLRHMFCFVCYWHSFATVSCCMLIRCGRLIMQLCCVGTSSCAVAWTVWETSWQVPAAAHTASNTPGQSCPGGCRIRDGENRETVCGAASIWSVALLQRQQLSDASDLCLVAWSRPDNSASQVCWWRGNVGGRMCCGRSSEKHLWRIQCLCVQSVSVLFCSLAVLDPRVGHTMYVLSPFLCPLSFWLTLPQVVQSTSWCCPSRPCVVFFACVHLALFLE